MILRIFCHTQPDKKGKSIKVRNNLSKGLARPCLLGRVWATS